ncbi:MAG TPA: ABC transporter permease [Blastocatellia bacterium]|nr:ABC transporter permease [Blastocatellia bacterium]
MNWWQRLWRRSKMEEEIEKELRFHLEQHTADLIARGVDAGEARRQARLALGGPEQVKEMCRDARGTRWLDDLVQDMRYGLRMMVKNPGFTTVVILTLALGIGANTAIFSVVNAVLLRPLPYPKADELVTIYNSPGGETMWPLSPVTYLNLKGRSNSFADIAALSNKGWPANLTGEGEPERLQGFQVSANLFSLLGVSPQLGRVFLSEEDHPGANGVVILSHEFWQRRFAADPQIIGQAITLNGVPYVVVGVMPADFRFLAKTDLWTPLAFTAADENDAAGYLEVIGRRKSGVSSGQAGAEVEAISREVGNKSDSEVRTRVGLPQALLSAEVRPMLLLLLGAVGFVLLIACANIANLLLARGQVRRREVAIRAALGAGRGRVMRQLLVENAVLAFIGGGFGLLLANWAIQFLAGGLPEYLADANSRVASLKVDGAALGFTFVLSLLTGALFSLVPALQLSRTDLNEALKEGGRSAGPRSRLRSALVVAEVALAMVLLVGGGLMIKSLWRLAHVSLGYEPAGVLTAKIDPSGARYGEFVKVTAFYRDLLERVRAIPGVRDAGAINSLNASFSFGIDEHPPLPPERQLSANINQVSGDYFRTMGIPLRAGRFFNDRDTKGAPAVVIIDETFAQQYFPGEDPIGKHINGEFSRGTGKSSREIVGVVGGARYWTLSREPSPHMYFSYLQENWGSMSLVVRAQSGDPMMLAAPVRAALAAVDKYQPIHSFKPLESTVSEMVGPQRFTTLLLSGFAALAAGLAAIGIYGVMSYEVAQRTREIGVRMALGAGARDVLKVIMGQGAKLIFAGVMIGLAASLALTRLIRDLLFGVEANDPATLAAITLLLVGVALLASFIPARRAAKVDPLVALRYE